MKKYFLVNIRYDSEKSKITSYFTKSLDNLNKFDYIFSEKYYPSFVISLQKNLVKDLLHELQKEIIVKEKENVTKVYAKNNETLEKCKKILQLSTNKNILLIEPERQFLIENDWNYYDSFCLINKNKINKISTSPITNINYIIKNMIDKIDLKIESRILKIAQKIIFTNYLKKKITYDITYTQATNYLLENYFFKNDLPQPQESKSYQDFKTKDSLNTIKIDFTKIWGHYLIEEEQNIGYETLNCNCCKPKSIYDINVLPHSLIKVRFIKNGFYFLSKNYLWSKEYHTNNKEKEKRERYKKQNNLTTIPIGPFYKTDVKKILLIDALRLYDKKEIEIIEDHEYKWFCKKKKSFLSEIIKEIIFKKNAIDKSIELTTKLNYSNRNLEKINYLEKNQTFYVYLSEQKIFENLLKEIILFIQNKNTKFYFSDLDKAIKNIKQRTYDNISKEEHRYKIRKETIITKDKSLLQKINNYFPKINVPLPEIYL
jgi:hypothetical protein